MMLWDAIADEFFWPYVKRSDTCWNWTGSKTGKGYGRTRLIDGVQVYAHRFSHELLIGPIPEGLEIDHLCRNHACVNPGHLEAVTHRENILRGTAKLYCPKGHLRSGYNLDNGNGRRRCRACHSERECARQRRAKEERQKIPRYCACGCGASIAHLRIDAKWASQACRYRARQQNLLTASV